LLSKLQQIINNRLNSAICPKSDYLMFGSKTRNTFDIFLLTATPG